MGDNIMVKQIILHYPGSYVERSHTLVFDDKDEYQEFLNKKSYKLKPNVTYGVFTLDATISTEYTSNNLKINTIQKSCSYSADTSTTKSVEITESNTSNEDDVIIID